MIFAVSDSSPLTVCLNCCFTCTFAVLLHIYTQKIVSVVYGVAQYSLLVQCGYLAVFPGDRCTPAVAEILRVSGSQFQMAAVRHPGF